MRRRRWPLAALALIAMVVLIGSGCGSNTPTGTASRDSSTASASGGNSTGSSSGSAANGGQTTLTKRDKAVKFAQCMRAHGVPHFPDPDASGDFNFGVDVSAAVFDEAVNACKALQPPGTLSGKRSPTQQSAALKFAQCIRANGVPDFPDPVNGQPVVNTYRIPSAATSGGMSILNAAMHKCGGVLRSAARGQG